MKHLPVLALSLALIAFSAPASAVEITVSAAASLTNAFTTIKGAFEQKHPDIQVSTNFAASNPLLQQMRQGAPVDVFASADQDTMNKAAADKLIDPATRRNFVANGLVLIVPLDARDSGPVKGVEDIAKAKHLAIGNPDSVPAGRYARSALTSMGLWDQLQPAFIQGASVRQVLDYVSRGEVDAGFVYSTDAFIAKDKVAIVGLMSGHDPILYPVAVTSGAKDKQASQAFVDFLFSAEGHAILQQYGFLDVK